MVIRFDRSDAPGEAAGKSHYSGFILPNDAVFSELLALLPERSDVLYVCPAIWRIREAGGKKKTVGGIVVDSEGAYTLKLPAKDLPCSEIEGGRITAECIYTDPFLIGDGTAEKLKERI